jgi:hypothetical protein
MIKGFTTETEPLSEYERVVLVPAFIRGLIPRVGKKMAVTNKHIVSSMKGSYKVSDARVRKVINYIRVNDLVPCLIATSDGYYIAESEKELKDYEESLQGREDAIRAVRLSINRQRKQKYGGQQQDLFNGK